MIEIAKKVLSIEIGLQETRVCEIIMSAGTHKVLRSIAFDTPANTIEDGYIRDKAVFSSELRAVIKNGKFGTNHAIFSVGSTKIYTKEIILPYVSESKIKEIIYTNLTDYLPFPMQDYAIQYSVLEKIKNKMEKKIRVLLIAMPENMVKNYYSIAEMTGLDIVSLDFNGNSVYQILKQVSEKGTYVYIQINEQSTIITILKDHILALQRIIAFGSNELVQAVIENNETVTEEQKAYEILHEEDFITKDVAVYEQSGLESAVAKEYSIHPVETTEAVSEAVSYLVSSVARVVDYYINQGGTAIQGIYLLGYGSRIKGMQKYIQKELGIYPKTYEQFRGYRAGKHAEQYQKNPSSFITSIGAVIHPIGFQPKDLVAKKAKRSNMVEIAILMSICLGGSALLYLVGNNDYKEATSELSQAQEILEGIPVQDDMTEDQFNQVLDQLEQLEALDESTKTNVEALYEIMEVFEDHFVTLADIKSMNVTNETISMSVSLPSNEAAAKMILQLQGLTDYFSEVNISGITESENETGEYTVMFSISCVFVEDQTSEGED